MLVVKVYCVTEAITVCGLNMAAMCAVVFGGSTDVPPIDGVEGPCPTGVGLLVNLGIASHGS